MKKVERGTVKYLIFLIFSVAIMGMILYPTFDFIFDKLINKSEFVYSFDKHIIQPIIFSLVYSITFWALDKKRK